MPMADGFPRRRLVDLVQGQGDFDEFLGGFDGHDALGCPCLCYKSGERSSRIFAVRPMRGVFFPVLPPTFLHPAESSDTGRPGPCLAILSGRNGLPQTLFRNTESSLLVGFSPFFISSVRGRSLPDTMCIWPASACPNLPTLRSMISRHLSTVKRADQRGTNCHQCVNDAAVQKSKIIAQFQQGNPPSAGSGRLRDRIRSTDP